MDKRLKDLYKGTFNFSREIITRYAYAFSEKQAKTIMMRRIAKKNDVPYSYVYGIFNDSSNNYVIEKETEFKEVENEADS